MGHILLLTLLALFGLSYGFAHIDHVNVDSLSSVHQQDFVSDLLHQTRRRALLETPDYFRLNGLRSAGGLQHDFVLKQAHMSGKSLKVTVDDSETVVNIAPIFHGYLVNDSYTLLTLSFPNLEEGDASPLGMVHHSNGLHSSLSFSEEFGIIVEEVEATPEGASVRHTQCDATSEEHHRHEDHDEEGDLSQKRASVGANGLPAIPLRVIDYVIETDQAFFSIHRYNTQNAVNYIMTVVAATNVIYERDIRATLVVRNIGLHSQNSPARDMYSLGSYLQTRPDIARLADAAVILQGAGSGGLAYIGTVCTPYTNVGHFGSHGAYGSNRWDAPEDLVMMAHETGHILGSHHTHDQTGYNPLIDSCGLTRQGSSIPPDGGSIMSYCHLTSGSNGYSNIRLYMGYVGSFGYYSERVNQRIVANFNTKSCLSVYTNPTSPSVPVPTTYSDNAASPPSYATCSDIANSGWSYSNGQPLNCRTEARAGRCSYTSNRAPYCMRSCGRCGADEVAKAPHNDSNPSYIVTFLPDLFNGTVDTSGPENATCTDKVNPALHFSDSVSYTCSELADFDFCRLTASKGAYCRSSCGLCDRGDSFDDDASEIEIIANKGDILFNQGTWCLANKGVPSAKFLEVGSTKALDDFIVPAGETWDVNEIKAMGLWFGSFDGVVVADVSIFHDGVRICHERGFLLSKTNTFSVSLDSDNCRVVGGRMGPDGTSLIPSDETYYVSIAPVLDLDDGKNVFYWSFSKSTNGESFLWKDGSDLLGKGLCNTWTDGSQCGFNTASSDLCFQVIGRVSPMLPEDAFFLDRPRLSNDGDGVVGSDSGEINVILTPEEKNRRKEFGQYLANLTKQISVGLDEEGEMATDIEGTPVWVIPVVLVFGCLAVLVAIAVASIITLRFKGVEVL